MMICILVVSHHEPKNVVVFFCEVKRFVRKGVPNEHRAKIWMAASGAQEQLENHRGYYQSLLAGEHDPKLKETIHIGEPQ